MYLRMRSRPKERPQVVDDGVERLAGADIQPPRIGPLLRIQAACCLVPIGADPLRIALLEQCGQLYLGLV